MSRRKRAGDEVAGLSLGTPQLQEKGLIEVKSDQPISRKAIHVGAPVASQQSRILRVDDQSITELTAGWDIPGQKNFDQRGLKT